MRHERPCPRISIQQHKEDHAARGKDGLLWIAEDGAIRLFEREVVLDPLAVESLEGVAELGRQVEMVTDDAIPCRGQLTRRSSAITACAESASGVSSLSWCWSASFGIGDVASVSRAVTRKNREWSFGGTSKSLVTLNAR